MRTYTKDPNAVLEYTNNWADWLGVDTIATSAWTVPTGITKDSDSSSSTATTIWLSGGSAGTKYSLTNRITTAAGRTEDRTIRISVQER